jgi:hypothetical protein
MVNLIRVWWDNSSRAGFWLWVDTGLGVVNVGGGRVADGLIAENVVDRRVDFKNEGWKK